MLQSLIKLYPVVGAQKETQDRIEKHSYGVSKAVIIVKTAVKEKTGVVSITKLFQGS
jgi:hypothetical protein